MAISYEPELLLARDQGLKLVSIGALVQRPLTSIIALPGKHVSERRRRSPASASAPPASPTRRPSCARRCSTPASSRRACSEVNVGFNLVPAMLSGKVDATLGGFWNYEAIQLRLMHRHPRRDPRRPGRRAHLRRARAGRARRRRRARDGQDLRAFLQALTRGEREVRADPAAAAALVVKANPSLEPKLQLESIKQTLPAALPAKRATRSAGRTPLRGRRSAAGCSRTGCSRTTPTRAACRRSPTSSCPVRESRRWRGSGC